MDIAAVRQGLADAAATIDGLNCYGYTPDSVSEPCFYPLDVTIDYDQTFARGMDQLSVTCIVLASRADDRAGQAKLDAYLAGSGSQSIKAAIEAARGAPGQSSLDGACDDLRVQRVFGYGIYEEAGVKLYGAKFQVQVIGEGDGS